MKKDNTTSGNENQNCFQNSNHNQVQTIYFGFQAPNMERLSELFEHERKYFAIVEILKKVDMWDSVILILKYPEKYSLEEIKQVNDDKKSA